MHPTATCGAGDHSPLWVWQYYNVRNALANIAYMLVERFAWEPEA